METNRLSSRALKAFNDEQAAKEIEDLKAAGEFSEKAFKHFRETFGLDNLDLLQVQITRQEPHLLDFKFEDLHFRVARNGYNVAIYLLGECPKCGALRRSYAIWSTRDLGRQIAKPAWDHYDCLPPGKREETVAEKVLGLLQDLDSYIRPDL